jgi:hypothetical protein
MKKHEMPLIYSKTFIESDYTNILLVDKLVKDYETIVSSVNANTFPIVYCGACKRVELEQVLSSFTNISRIAICNEVRKSNLFLDFEPLFKDNEIQPYSQNVEFMIKMIKQLNIKNLDFLACDTLNNLNWKEYYNILHLETGVIIGASDDKTGNMKYGGDWVLESTNTDAELIYFTQSIEFYKYLLDVTPNWQTFTYTFIEAFRSASIDIDIANIGSVQYSSNGFTKRQYLRNLHVTDGSYNFTQINLSGNYIIENDDYIDFLYDLNNVYDGFAMYGATGFKISRNNLVSFSTSFVQSTPKCYNKGTLIKTINGYQKIENLKQGSMIHVYPDSFKPISHIGFKKLINNPSDYKTMYIMKKSNSNNLIEDLIVSGLHHVYDANYINEPNIKIQDKILIEACRSKLFSKVQDNEEYEYYHFVLEGGKQCGICANGLLSESMEINGFLQTNFQLIDK